MIKISIVIPTYNEKDNLLILIPKINKVLKSNGLNANVIIVDDNSPDGTGEIADQLSKKYPIKVIHRPSKLGLGTAHIEGMKKAIEMKSDIIFTMDADLSHKPEYIPDFIKMLDICDVVIGSRYVKGGRMDSLLHRRIISRGGNLIAKIMLGIKVNDVTTGYRAYKSKVLNQINLDNINSNGFSFLEEILYLCYKAGFLIKETPIIFTNRGHGFSKLGWNEMIKFIFTIFKLRWKN